MWSRTTLCVAPPVSDRLNLTARRAVRCFRRRAIRWVLPPRKCSPGSRVWHRNRGGMARPLHSCHPGHSKEFSCGVGKVWAPGPRRDTQMRSAAPRSAASSTKRETLAAAAATGRNGEWSKLIAPQVLTMWSRTTFLKTKTRHPPGSALLNAWNCSGLRARSNRLAYTQAARFRERHA